MSGKSSNNGRKSGKHLFGPGNPGGPGRPSGSRNKASLIADALADGELEGIVRSVIEDAKAGDPKAREIILNRAWPPRKGRPVALNLPPIADAKDLVAAIGAVADAVAGGDVTPEEGQAVAAVLESKRRMLEIADLEVRVRALEKERSAT